METETQVRVLPPPGELKRPKVKLIGVPDAEPGRRLARHKTMEEKMSTSQQRDTAFPPAIVRAARQRVANVLARAVISRFEYLAEADVFATFTLPKGAGVYNITYSEMRACWAGTNEAADRAAAARRAGVFKPGRDLGEWARERALRALRCRDARLQQVAWGMSDGRICAATFRVAGEGTDRWVQMDVPGID